MQPINRVKSDTTGTTWYGKNSIDEATIAWHPFECRSAMPPSSLEDRVRELCAQVTAAETEAELNVNLPQLQTAIRDHILHPRAIAVEVIPEALERDSKAS